MNKHLRTARRLSGLARFERNPNARRTMEFGRMRQAWLVPGTPEAGQHTMLRRWCENILANLMAEGAPVEPPKEQP